MAPWLGDRPGQGSDPLVVTVDAADAETTYSQVVTLGGSSVLFVGRDGGYQARSLFRFALADTLVQSYGESRLTLTLQSAQNMSPVRFHLYRVGQFWNETVVTWERANTDSTGDLPWDVPGGVTSAIAVAEAGPCSLTADTVRVVFSIDAETTRQIYAEHVDNFGFMIRLDDEGAAQALWRFHSREQAVALRPTWEVDFVDTAGVDTARVIYAAADAAIVHRIAPVDEDRLLVGSGVGYRSLLRFPMPDVLDSTATVNFAMLYLYSDTARTFLETKTMQVDLVDSMWKGDSTAVLTPYVNQSLAIPGRSVISFAIGSAVKAWVTGAVENNGLMLRFSGEDNTVAYCPLFGMGGPSGLVPRLEIHYTKPPEPPQANVPPRPAIARSPGETT